MPRIALALALMLIASGAMAGCTREAEAPETTTPAPTTPSPIVGATPTPQESQAETRTLYGVTLSPRGFDEDNFSAFLLEARAAGDVITWAGDWAQLGEEDGTPARLAEMAQRQRFAPLFVATFFEQDEGKLLRPLDEASRARYENQTVRFVTQHDVPFLGLGLEVNVLEQKNPEALDAFAQWWPDLYATVKRASPDTFVFPVFQYEHLLGHQGGLFGGNRSADPQWDLLERFEPRDATAITTYPGFVFADPRDLPDDYYAQLREHVDGPIAVVETGWFADSGIEGWGSTPSEQDRFVERLLNGTDAMGASLVVWLFLFDQPERGVFSTMGLFTSDGEPRPAFHRWNQQVQASRA